jgi:membrane protein CcdC involved in cytochrome C biogenesis
MPHSATPYVAIVLVVLFMVLRMARSMRGRQIKMNGLWIMPIILVFLAATDLYQAPPDGPLAVVVLIAATLLGAAVGWWRGRLTRIDLDPKTGVLMSRASPAAVILIIGLLAVRYALRLWIAESGKGASLVTLSNALLFFGFAMLAVARVEMWIRCRRLIDMGDRQF